MKSSRARLQARFPWRTSPQVRARARSIRQLRFEALEGRVMLSTVTWNTDESGSWDVASNWKDDQGNQRVPAAGDDVVINRPSATPTVTYDSGSVAIKSLTTQDPFVLAGGPLTVTGSLQAGSTFTLAGGSLANTVVPSGVTIQVSSGTLAGVTVDGTLDLASSGGNRSVSITGGLVLNGTALLGAADGSNSGRLLLYGAQTLGGNGSVLFGGYAGDGLSFNPIQSGDSLTIGAGITVHGGAGTIDGTSVSIRGTVAADVSGGSIYVEPAAWTNAGTLSASNGGNLVLAGAWTDSGAIDASAGSTAYLAGNVSLGSGRSFATSAGTLELNGTLGLAGSTLALDGSTGSLLLAGGTINGGTVSTAAGSRLVAASSGTLAGVTVDGTLDLASSGGNRSVSITGGLVLNGTALLGAADGSNSGRLLLYGAQTLGGNGSVLFGGYAGDGLSFNPIQSGDSLTIGAGITVHGGAGSIDSNSSRLVNQGIIDADVTGGAISVNGGTLTNSGTLKADAGSLYLYGTSLADTGTVVANSGNITVDGSSASFSDPGALVVRPSATFSLFGNLVADTQNVSLFQPGGTVTLTGSGTSATPQLLEVMSQDEGNNSSGYNQNFAYGTLKIASTEYVRLIDSSRNTASTAPEALYVNSLVVPSGATLDLNGLHLYFRTAQINGSVVGGTASRLNAGGPLSLGSPTPGTIQVGGEVDTWTVFGRAGESIAVVVGTGGGTPAPLQPSLNYAQVRLLDATGKQIAVGASGQAGTDASIVGAVLPSDGTYQVQVQAAPAQASSTGNYVIAAYDATVHTMPASLNQAYNGQVYTPYSQDRWTFSALAGNQVRFDLIAAANPSITFGLAGPNGSAVFSGLTASSDLLTLPASGTYTLTVTGESGAYAFQIVQTAQTTLTLGTPYQGALASGGQAQVFLVNVPTSNPLLVTLQDPNAADHDEVYLQYGSAPTRESYQYRYSNLAAANQQVLAPSASPGNWYILVYGDTVPTPSTYTLTATAAEVFLFGVTPTRQGNTVDTVMTINGAGFNSGTTVALIAADGKTTYTLKNPTVDSPTQITATIPANAIPAGTYTVRVSEADGASASLPAVFTATQGGQAVLKTNLVVPNPVGNHLAATIYIQYSNTGDVAMPAPLLVLTASRPANTGGGTTDGALLTLDPANRIAGQYTSATPAGYSNSIQLLAGGASPGLLEPGESIQVPVYYAGWIESEWNFTNPSITFSLGVLDSTNTTPVDWASIQASSRPDSIDPTAWSGIFGNLVAQTGATYGAYVKRLDDESTYLGTLGETVTDVGQLYGAEIQQADGLSPITQLGAAVDASVAAPGLSLSFGRSFSPSIAGRYQSGTFGLGWSDSWQTSLAVQSDGTVIVTGPGGSQRQFQPDSRGNGSYFNQAGDYGKLAAIGNGTYTLTEQDGAITAFNTDGTLHYVQDTNGNRITAGYTNGLLTTLTHSSGQALTIAYNTAGLITSVTDPVGRKTTYTYDASNTHLMTATTFDGQVTSYAYATGGAAATNNALLAIAYPDGTHDYFTYDAQGRFATTSADGGAEKTTYTYGTTGAVTSTDALGGSTLYDYDARGLIARVTDALGHAVHFTYDANYNLTQVVDPAGQATTSRYDATGNLLSTTDPLGHTTSFSYATADDRLTSVTDANGNATQYGYDGQGNLTSTTYADGTVESLAYDPIGNVINATNRRGQIYTCTNDYSGRLISRTYLDGTEDVYAFNSRGNLVSTTDPTGTTTLAYDASDRLIQITYPTGLYLKYTYDAAGRRTKMVDQSGFTVNYFYDAVGRLSLLTDGTGANVDTYTYDDAGRRIREVKGNGSYSTYAYDLDGELLSLVNFSSNGTVESRFDYVYNLLGLKVGEKTLDGAWTYSYDALGQLTHAVFGSTNPLVSNQDLMYNYDASGNRTSTVLNGVTTSYTTNDLNEYTRIGDSTLRYDADGNLISEVDGSGNTTSFVYNQSNQLVGMNGVSLSVNYTYNSLGERVSQIINGTTTNYLVDPSGLGNLVSSYDASNSVIADYIYGSGLVSQTVGGAKYYYQFDGLGSTVSLSDSTGTNVDGYDYLPFGETLFSKQTVVNPFQYVGSAGVMVVSNGLQFMRARYEDPSQGRFISLDPLGVRTPNLYAYGANDPIRFVDPSGLNKDIDDEFNQEMFGFTICGDDCVRYSDPQTSDEVSKAQTNEIMSQYVDRSLSFAWGIETLAFRRRL